MLVEVRPLPLEKWHKKKDQEAFAQAKTIEVLYDRQTGAYATGLTPEEAQVYGKRLGVDLSDKFDAEIPHSYWSTKAAQIKLQNATMIFDDTKALDYVRIRNMKASKFVANSMKEWQEGKYPEATHVIFDEKEALQEKASKVETKRKAYQLLSNLTHEDKVNIVRILSEKSVRQQSPNFIEVEIDTIIDEKPLEFLKLIEMGREEVNLRATVLELLSRNILTKEGSAVFYMGDQLATDYEGAVAYFRDPNNSKLKVTILEKLEAQK